jgi:hypothetical protein
MPRERTTNNKEYATNRAALLKGQPMCHWCHRKVADTADHLVEVDRGGDHSLSNLVPACRECNSRRGTQYKSARDRQRIHDRAEATRTPINSESIKSYLDDCCFDVQFNPNSTLSGTEAYIIKMISKIAVGSATVWWSVIELRQFIKNRKSL